MYQLLPAEYSIVSFLHDLSSDTSSANLESRRYAGRLMAEDICCNTPPMELRIKLAFIKSDPGVDISFGWSLVSSFAAEPKGDLLHHVYQ